MSIGIRATRREKAGRNVQQEDRDRDQERRYRYRGQERRYRDRGRGKQAWAASAHSRRNVRSSDDAVAA